MIKETAAKNGRTGKNAHVLQRYQAVAIIDTAAGILVGWSAAQSGGITKDDNQALQRGSDIPADVKAAPQSFGVHVGGQVQPAREIGVPAPLNGYALRQDHRLADFLTIDTADVDAAANAGDANEVTDRVRCVNGFLNAAIKDAIPLSAAARQFIPTHVEAVIGRPEIILKVHGEGRVGIAHV